MFKKLFLKEKKYKTKPYNLIRKDKDNSRGGGVCNHLYAQRCIT